MPQDEAIMGTFFFFIITLSPSILYRKRKSGFLEHLKRNGKRGRSKPCVSIGMICRMRKAAVPWCHGNGRMDGRTDGRDVAVGRVFATT